MDGRNYAVTFEEESDTSIQIVDDEVFITDEDIESKIVSITINITNAQLDTSQEFLSLSQNPPEEVEVTGINTHLVVISAPNPSLSRIRDFFVTALLRLRYRNTADEPIGVNRLIEFTISDGRLTNDPIVSTTVSIVEINDVPVVDLNGDEDGVDGFVEYTESNPPILIAGSATLNDPDSPMLTQISIIFEAFDIGSESVAVDLNILPSGSPITCNVSPCNGTNLVLSGSAPGVDYQSLLRTLSYVNLKQPEALPNLRDRVITVQVNDGETSSAADTEILIDFISINPRVIIQLDVPNQDFSTQYTEGQAQSIPVVGDQVRIVDTSLETLQSVDLTIRSNLPGGVREPGEEISINTAELGGLEIGIEIHTILKRITFSGEAPLDHYLQAIKIVRYRNTEDEPDPTTRYIDVVVNPGGGAPVDTAFTNITIININDHSPICSPAFQTAFVSEDTQPVQLIHTLVATDADIGVGASITYSQTEGDSSLFSTSSSGNVSLNDLVNFEGINSYTIEVQVCDDGILPDQFCCNFTLQINVTDFNDNPPVFSQETYTLSVAENTVTDITTFIINDEDSGTNAEIVALNIVSGTFVPGSGCLGFFSVSANPPTLATVSPGLDFETRNSCQFNISATDGGGANALTGTAMITINVLNEDDFPPVFSQLVYEFNVQEDNTFPLSIDSVTATDIDSPSFTYSLQNAPGFQINTTSGEISILFSTDYDLATNYNFECVATDPNSNSGTADVVVTVIPINNDPPTLDLNSTDPNSNNSLTPIVFVEESNSPVTLLTEPDITDPDQVPLVISEIRARIANSDNPSLEELSLLVSSTTPVHTDVSPADSSVLVIQPSNPMQLSEVYQLIQSIQYVNYEDEISPCNSNLYACDLGSNSRTILIKVSDSVNDSPEREVYVTFEAVNDAPELDLDTNSAGTEYETLFREGEGAIDIVNVGFVSLTDDDNTQLVRLECTLTNPQDGTDEFLVLTGTIPNGLTATVSDDGYTVTFNGSASTSSYVSAISIIQYNSTTNDPSETERDINCFASDGEADSNIAKAEISYSTRNQIPSLDLNSLSAIVNFSITFEEEGGAIVLTGDVVIFDPDDNTMSSLEVTLTGASSTQESLALNHGYSLPSQLTIVTSPSELVVTGLASIPDYRLLVSNIVYNNTASEISDVSDRLVQFVVEDDGGAESKAAFTIITISPVDDNAPIFVPVSEFSVDENSANETQVGTIEVRDFDEPAGNDVPSFSLTAASVPSFGRTDFFVINNPDNQYQAFIRVAGTIDYDNRATSYSLVVQATSGNFSSNITVNISVTNLPDTDPIFTVFPAVFQVFENENIGTLLMPSGVTAVDPDNLDTISYSISGNVVGGVPLINIGFNTGELTVAGSIDRESPFSTTEFDVTITASDSNAMVQGTATIEVLGVNESPPVFSPANYVATIDENAPPGLGPLVTVTATDADEGPDETGSSGFMSNITYAIRQGSGSDLFEIDENSGEIEQLSPVDFEEFNSIMLVVEASDNDFPMPLTSTVVVEVVVSNINDEAPFFENLPASRIVSELSPQASTVFTVEFDDPDVDKNLQVRFIPPTSDPFSLNLANGELTVTVPLDADTVPREYMYTVELTDLNTDSTFSSTSSVSAQLNITLEDKNDNIPVFSSSSFEGDVMENLAPGQFVLQVRATDDDYGFTPTGVANGNNIVRYTLGSDAPEGVFVIDLGTGNITTNRTLNREEQDVYIFTVIAWDSPVIESANLRTTQVRINVVDENEHSPEADPSQYFIFVEENTSPSLLQTYVASQWNSQGNYANRYAFSP